MQPERADTALNLSVEEKHEMIAVAAYYLAEQRGFPGEGALDDWVAAERQIDRMLERMRQEGANRCALERLGLRNALKLWGQGGEDAVPS
jgi:hypothetical protein